MQTLTVIDHIPDFIWMEILFPLDAVPSELLPLVPLMGRSLTEMGTSKRDFVELGTLVATLSQVVPVFSNPLLKAVLNPTPKPCKFA